MGEKTMQCDSFKAAAWKAWLPLLALIICSTISAAPRACSLACWYRIFCFSISFSWQAEWQVQSTRMIWLLASMLQFPLGDGVPQRSFLYPLLLPLPRPLRSSADTGQSFRTLYLEDFVFSNFIIVLEGTFAIMSAYAIYNGSSSRWLKRSEVSSHYNLLQASTWYKCFILLAQWCDSHLLSVRALWLKWSISWWRGSGWISATSSSSSSTIFMGVFCKGPPGVGS